jgi:hypothetical protein
MRFPYFIPISLAALSLTGCASAKKHFSWLGPIGFSVEVGPVKAGITLLGTARSTPEIPDLPDLPDLPSIHEPEPLLPTK